MNILQNISNGIKSNLEIFSFEDGITEDRYKKFAELSIFFSYCSSDHFGEDNNDIIKNFLLEKIKKIPADDIFKNPYMVFHIAMPYVFLRKFEKIDLFESSLKIMFKNNMFSFEVPPHRQMEWSFIKNKMGLQNKFKLCNPSILTQNIYVSSVNREIAYAISHSLFYITDFGVCPPPDNLLNIEKLKFQLECMIVKFYKENDLDVVLELSVNYFSLITLTELNFKILNIVDDCITKNSFLENKYFEKVFIKKYHSLFVIGILFSQLNNHLNNSSLSIDVRKKLEETLASTVFSGNKIQKEKVKKLDLGNSKEFLAWEALLQLKNKEMNKEVYTEYVDCFGVNYFLELEIISNLKLLKNRNENSLLWDRELEYFKLDKKSKKLLIKEYQNKIELEIKFHENMCKDEFIENPITIKTNSYAEIMVGN
ncbi:hypothetical protein ACEN2I_13610 [Flavobacterium sp. W22_SRS_FK3]|uniref:DUF6895 family protein n=1 Tax=Flavobacterium sp. W22_SRS_FK3 TaxID=3240275 RepID=UPI003F8FF814